jgi:hypothetical protein
VTTDPIAKLTLVIVERVCTVSPAEPLLALCTLVAENEAVMLCVPDPKLLGVTATWHVEIPVPAGVSEQLPVMVSPESELTATVPVGGLLSPLESLSVTVTVAVVG